MRELREETALENEKLLTKRTKASTAPMAKATSVRSRAESRPKALVASERICRMRFMGYAPSCGAAVFAQLTWMSRSNSTLAPSRLFCTRPRLISSKHGYSPRAPTS